MVEFGFYFVIAWCPDLGPIANGSMYPSEGIMQVGDFVNFECDTGFHISGVSTIGCRAGGTWSGPKPTCLIGKVYGGIIQK